MSDVTIGPYRMSEIPEPWVHSWDDALGDDIDLDGFSVDVYYKINRGTQVILDDEASLFDATTGRTIVNWASTDFTEAGIIEGELWVYNDTLRLAQGFVGVILPPRGGAFQP